MAEKNNLNHKGLHTVIGSGTVIEGTVKVSHDVRVDGTIKGKIDIEGDLIVGSTGVIEADIEARSTKLGGKVVGNLTTKDRIELEENASIIGDIKTKELVINEGAVFHGNCSMQSGKDNGK
jgi:cytoskeletal protein CcmA (bactofilin family)